MSVTKIQAAEPVKPVDMAPHTDDDAPSSTDSDASAGEHTPVPEDKRCKYPSKFCGRARVRKSNGTFHRFCQYHRIKANTNQKRWTSVRRQQAAHEEQQRRRAEAVAVVRQATVAPAYPTVFVGEMTASTHWTPGLLPDPVSLSHSAEPVGLALEDVQILKALFLSDMQDAPEVALHPSNCSSIVTKLHAFEHCDIAL